MNYFDAFEEVKKALEKLKPADKTTRFAVQVRLSDEDACGTFYILLSQGKITAEPYDYYDNNADIYTSLKTFLDILSGKLDIKKAVSEKMISVSGDGNTLWKLFEGSKSTAKKATVKTAATSKKATAKKKTEVKKMSDDKKKPQVEEVIKEVVEKETNPKK